MKKVNQETTEQMVAQERARASGAEPLLIRPTERPLPYEGSYPFGEPAALPEIACVGRFVALSPVRTSADYSELVVIWFQDALGLPSETEVWPQLRARCATAAAATRAPPVESTLPRSGGRSPSYFCASPPASSARSSCPASPAFGGSPVTTAFATLNSAIRRDCVDFR